MVPGTIPVLQMRRLMYYEVKGLAQNHRGTTWWSWNGTQEICLQKSLLFSLFLATTNFTIAVIT